MGRGMGMGMGMGRGRGQLSDDCSCDTVLRVC
jgi:hypothetical protein